MIKTNQSHNYWKKVNNLDKVITYVKYSRIYKILLELMIELIKIARYKELYFSILGTKENQIKLK